MANFLLKSEKKLLLLYLLQFLCVDESQADRQCKADLDCNKPLDYIKCAYCSKGKCEIIDRDIFRPELPCQYNRDHCTAGYCKSEGINKVTKFEGLGECVCDCTTVWRYGNRCEFEFPKSHIFYSKYPSGIQFITPPHTEFDTFAPIIIIVSTGPNPVLMVEDTIGGFLIRIGKPIGVDYSWGHKECVDFARLDERIDNGVCDFIKWKFSKTVYIAYFNIPFDFTTEPGEKITSFTRELELNVYHPINPKLRLSLHTHRYHINYPDPKILHNTPILRFPNCDKKVLFCRTYELKDTIPLKIDFFYVSESYSLVSKPELLKEQLGGVTCDVRRIDLDGDTFKYRFIDYHFMDPEQPFWYFPPFKSYGMFVLECLIKRTIPELEKKRGYSGTCFFKIGLSPLVAEITGGSSRSAYTEHGLILDASKSRNPNTPDGKKDLRLTFTCNWTSEAVCDPHTVDGVNYEPYTIKPMVLRSQKAYKFTLKVIAKSFGELKPAFATQIIVVRNLGKNEGPIENMRVDCIYNCEGKTNPKDIVCLRVGGPWTVLYSLPFQWVLYEVDENGVHKEVSVDPIRQSDTSPFILITNEDALKENATYEFKVNYRETSQFATYPITTTFVSPLTCNIIPESGESGFTHFKLSCLLSNLSKTFEFYDKYEADGPDFSGRMIASQETGNIENFVLTRGKLEIISFNDYGIVATTTLNVPLSKSNRSSAYIEQILSDLINGVQGVGDSLKTASVVSDLTSVLQDKKISRANIFETLLRFLSTLSIKRYEDAKLGVSTLHISLLVGRGSLSLDSAWHAARTIHTLAQVLAVGLKEGRHCTFRVLYQIFSRFLDCLYIVLEVEEKYVGNGTLLLQYSNPVIYTRVKEISQYVMKSSFFLQSALSYRHLPAQKQKLIESSLGNLSMWIKVDIPMALSKYTQDEHRTKMFPAIVPNNLAEDVKKMGFYLGLQFLSFKRDPTWSARTNTGDTLDVSVCFKGNDNHTCLYPKVLKHGIQVAFDISDLISQVKFTNLTIRRLDHRIDPDQLDIELPVYKLDPLPLADVEAHFRLYDDNTELLVLVKKDMRPTYALLMNEIPKVTPTSPVYPVVTDPSDKQHLYFLAIQPGAKIQLNGTVSFDIKIYSKMCYAWHNHWEPRGCHPKTVPGTSALICECHRLSLIGGLVEEVMYSLEVVRDFPLSPTISSDNAAKVLGLLLLLITFLLLALICRKADRHDRTKRFVSILPDNFPGEKFGFLVCVVTGARVGAGTDAAVGIKIFGTMNDGRSHILSSKTHDVMEGMGEDWFLIFEAGTLGKLTCLDLWHDNAGAKADWFCDSITIYDLHHRDCYFFVVNDWITLSLKRFPQTCLFPTPFSEITSPSRVFLDYFKSGFQLSHLWLDTIARHPRDPVSRIDRLAIIVCFILVSMAISIIFIAISDNYMEVDDFSYSLTWLMVEVSVYTCIPAAAIACILMHMFRRIYKIIFYIKKEEEKITHERRVTRISLQEDFLSSPSTTSLSGDKSHIHYGRRHKHPHEAHHKRTLAEAINLILMPKPLVPVQIEGDEPNVIIQMNWLLITWITVVAIIIISISLSLFLSINLPLTKTMKWLTIVGLSIFIHAFIILPLKVTFVSALLAVAFKRIIYKDVYTFDPMEGLQLYHFGMVRYLTNLVHLRSQPMYQPLHEVFREEHRQKMLRAGRWRRLYELVVQIVFLVVLATLLRKQIPTQYQTNAHLRTLMKNFDKVYNTTDLKYLQHYCEPYLFKYIWYNWEILSQGSEQNFFRKDWMYDSVNRIVGKVRLRQFRVKPGYCKESVNLSIDCAAPFSGRAEDSEDYFTFWIRQDGSIKKDELIGITLLSTWSYHRPSDDSNFFYDGKTGQTYPSGGYTWDLGASDEEMDASLIRLWEEGWIGHYTRAVLAQVKVYNVNTRLFSEIALVSEQTIAGQVLSTTVVHSVDTNIQLDWWLTIFIFFAFMLCVRVFVLTNFVGVMGLFKSWRRPYELLVTVNALAVLLYLLLHLLTVPQYVTEYQLHFDDLEFFDFYKIAHYSFTARALLCALYVLNQIRFYSLWRFGETVFRYFLIIVFSIKYVLWLVLIFVLFQLLLFRIVGYLLLIFIDVVFNPNMFYRHNYSYFSVSKEMIGFKILCFMMNFSSVIIMMIFVCIFVHQYKTARYESIRHWNIDNYFTFIHDEIKAMLRKPAVRKTTMKLAKTMVGMHEEKKKMYRMQSQTAL